MLRHVVEVDQNRRGQKAERESACAQMPEQRE
jgi:hypothetical protein